MSEKFVKAAEELLDGAHAAANREGIGRLKAENRLVGEACEQVAELSEAGHMSESEMNALADQLSDALARYTKTDLKSEFKEHYAETGGEGVRFDDVLETRLERLQTVHSTDAKQGTVWRWHFSDGVQLETETSKDGGRKHYDWKSFKRDYFDSLISLNKGERIAKPSADLRDPEAWQDWIDGLILENSEPVEHVGPRTESVRMLRDYVSRNVAYLNMKDMRDRAGVWVDAEVADDADAIADGGVSELRIPLEQVQRVCDQTGVSTRGLQIELEARGVTHEDTNGVSGATYIDGKRVPYWAFDPSFAEPEEIIDEPKSPAEKAREREEEAMDDERTAVGAVEGEEDGKDDGGASPAPPSPHTGPDEETEDDYEPGLTGTHGRDPDEVEDDE